MSEWKEYKAKEFCQNVTDGTHDSPKPQEFGHYLITSKHLKDNIIDFSSANYISEEDYNKVTTRSAVDQYDILFSMIGTIGNVVQVKMEYIDFAVKNMGIFKFGRDKDKSTWLYYWLKTPQVKEYIHQRLAGSTQAYLTLNSLREFPILYPEPDIANKIISILSSLDDKIELNRRINENLEAQAQALFKSWFVDFEPFRDGEFVESELGMIPKGWRVGRLYEIASINPTRSIKKGDKATYLDMKNMPTSGPFPLLCETKEYTGGMRFQNQDTLMARITPCLENGKVAYVNFLEEKEIAFGSTEYIVMTTKDGFLPELLYFLCRDEYFKGYATKNMNGSSGRQRVSGETIGNYKIPLPPKSLLEPIAPYFKSVMDTIRNNGFESRRLATLRDTLLPRLMSGELKVNEL
jgi:type I restriction enzyme S subunit